MRNLVGRKKVDFTKNSERVLGVKLYHTGIVSGVEGLEADGTFIRSDNGLYELALSIPVGSKINFVYTRRGGLEDLQIVEVSDPQEAAKK